MTGNLASLVTPISELEVKILFCRLRPVQGGPLAYCCRPEHLPGSSVRHNGDDIRVLKQVTRDATKKQLAGTCMTESTDNQKVRLDFGTHV